MSDEFVNTKWAKVAVEIIEHAISECEQQNPGKVPIRVVWGHPNKEEADAEREVPKEYQHQHGLINWLDLDFELLISQHGDPDHPNLCHISTYFPEQQELPLSHRELYNLMRSCQDAITLSLHPAFDSGAILVFGVQTCISVENLTGRILYDALFRLSTSHQLAMGWLAEGSGDDYWKMDGGT